MPHGHPDADDSARGMDHAHRSDLKRKAEGISRSLSEVFTIWTHGTASLKSFAKGGLQLSFHLQVLFT